MPLISRWMIAFGALIGVAAVVGWGTGEAAIRSGLLIGLAMVGAGAAAAQGRRSLRRTGVFIGMVLPLLTAAVAGWRAWDLLHSGPAQRGNALAIVILIVLASAGIMTVLILMKLRTADRVAEHGYSISPLPPAPSSPVPPAADAPAAPEERARQEQ